MIDTHCHLDVPAFDADRAAVWARAREAGLSACVVPGISVADLPRVLALAETEPAIFAAVGIHPHECESWGPETEARVRELARHPKVVAIGEIGLDYHYDYPKDRQSAAFAAQIRLAAELGKPIIVHDREAHGDVLEALKAHLDPRAGGVMHCFSGSYEFALDCIKVGMLISFAGSVTFKNAVHLQDVAARLPLTHLLIETDAPYMTPVPHRGKRNEPAMVAHTAAKLAELRGVSVEAILEATTENARRLFGLRSA